MNTQDMRRINSADLKPGDFVQIANGDWWKVESYGDICHGILGNDIDYYLVCYPRLITDHKTAAEYAEMQKVPSDTEMLSWLEKQDCQHNGKYVIGQIFDNSGWCMFYNGETDEECDEKYVEAPTLRQAIAVAMVQESEDKNEVFTAQQESEVGE